MKMEAHIKRVETYESSCNKNTKNQRWGNKIVEEGIVYVFFVACADDKLQEAINNFPPNTVSSEEKLSQVVCFMNKFLVSKETVVLRRWERSKQKFGFINSFDKTKFLFCFMNKPGRQRSRNNRESRRK